MAVLPPPPQGRKFPTLTHPVERHSLLRNAMRYSAGCTAQLQACDPINHLWLCSSAWVIVYMTRQHCACSSTFLHLASTMLTSQGSNRLPKLHCPKMSRTGQKPSQPITINP